MIYEVAKYDKKINIDSSLYDKLKIKLLNKYNE